MSMDTSSFTIVMGDFNAEVDKKINTDEKEMGAYGLGERNERGERLLAFVASRNLVIGNTLFKKTAQQLLDMGESKRQDS